MKSKRRPSLGGRKLSDAELAQIRAELECFDTIGDISDELRALIADQWPDLYVKIIPKQNNRRKDLPYKSGRSKRWLTIKNPDSPAIKRVGTRQQPSPYRFIARVAFSRTLHGMSGVGPIPNGPDKSAA